MDSYELLRRISVNNSHYSTMPCSARYPLSFLLTVIFLLVDLCLAGVLAPTVLSHTNEIPSELFNSLSELSRLVDISYCVGSSGIQPPFQCLKNCDRFKGFELVTVRIPLPFYPSPKTMNLDVDTCCLLCTRHGIPALCSLTPAATSHYPTHPLPSES